MNEDTTALKLALITWGEQVVDTALAPTVDGVKGDAPVGSDPSGERPGGELRDSIHGEVAGRGLGTTRATITVDAPQGRYTDKGTVPHVISPRPGGRLRFYSRQSGGIIVLPVDRSVNHPGNAAQNWWEPALRKHWGDQLRSAAASTPLR